MLAHWAGQDNLLWRVECQGQEAVVKLYLDAGQARGRRQYDGQQMFAPFGFAPRPLWFDRYPQGLSRQVLVYAWAPGEAIAPGDANQLADLARTVAQVHSADPSEVRRFCPNPLNLDYLWRVLQGGFPAIRAWLETQQAAPLSVLFNRLTANAQMLVEAALPLWQQTPPTPVHGDLKLANTLWSLDAAVLLDWELFGLGDPAQEVASFLHTSQNELNEAAQETWLESYLTTFDQPGLAERIGVYRRVLPLQALCYLLRGLYKNSPDPAGKLAIRENQPFLQSALSASFQQVQIALHIDTPIGGDVIEALFMNLQ